MADDLMVLGLDQEAAQYAQQAESACELWPDNVTTFKVFDVMGRQWRTVTISSLGGSTVRYQGLDYGVIRDVLILMGIKRGEWSEIFEGLRVMEKAALKVFEDREAD